MPAFVKNMMTKNVQDAHVAMLKDHDDVKNKKEEKRKKLISDMKLAEASVCIGLEHVTMPQKTSLHSTNLTTGENASTKPALLSSGKSSNEKKILTTTMAIHSHQFKTK